MGESALSNHFRYKHAACICMSWQRPMTWRLQHCLRVHGSRKFCFLRWARDTRSLTSQLSYRLSSPQSGWSSQPASDAAKDHVVTLDGAP
eukprot:1161646-Pelagomonas_calceolata.AAC.12